jgi:hypothetical protein
MAAAPPAYDNDIGPFNPSPSQNNVLPPLPPAQPSMMIKDPSPVSVAYFDSRKLSPTSWAGADSIVVPIASTATVCDVYVFKRALFASLT